MTATVVTAKMLKTTFIVDCSLAAVSRSVGLLFIIRPYITECYILMLGEGLMWLKALAMSEF